MKLTFDYLSSLEFQQLDMNKCCRCDSEKTLELKTHPDYGTLPYSECPKCRKKGIYPWGGFYYLQPNQVKELEN